MENKFEMLTAVDTADKIEIYTEALDQALGINEVTNIAITGSYGSGKSSFLRTYEKNFKNKNWKFLNISLATFKDINKIEEENPVDGSGKENIGNSNPVHGIDNSIIEKSILQQIFYRVKDEEIPESRFKQIKSLNLNEIKKHTLFLGYMIIFPLIFFYTDSSKVIGFLKKLGYPWFSLPAWLPTISFSILILFFAGLLAVYLYKIVKYFSAHNISKVNFKKAEMEVNKQDEKSILNEYLDEILYFFEVTKYNVVVIEDLDRFNNTEIFIKLRELNKLLNDSEQVNNRIVFIYAIRDDMFTDKSRTKFFDFLIPIVPYINPSNSYSKLLDLFADDLENTDDRRKPLSKSFLRDISLYIDDMRLLTSVHNEYLIYKSQVCGDNADCTKILAMMVYKNFYPNDFSKLHLKEGTLYNIFINKNKYIEHMITDIEEKIENKLVKIQELNDKYKDEKIRDINELRTIYLAKIYAKTGGARFYINGQNYDIVHLENQINNDVFTVIREASDIRNQHNYHTGLDFKSIEQEINPNLNYNEREAYIMEGYADKVEVIKKEIDPLKNQKEGASLYTISEIIEQKDSPNMFEHLDKKYNLLKYLIMYGYIDEHYYDYISHFFEGAITIKDRDFLQSVKINNIYPFNYTLEHIEEVVKQLEDKDFTKGSILNFSLLEYLSSKSDSKRYKLLLKKLSDGSQQSQNFILEYMDKKDNADKKRDFIHDFAKVNIELWVFINQNEKLSYDKKISYLELILHNSNIEDIKNLNHTNELTQFINKLESLELFSYFDKSDLKELYSVLNIKFEKIKDFPEYLIPFDVVFENRNYQLNEHMIDEILSRKIDVSQYKDRYYTTILESDMKLLVDYINEHLNEFIENVFLKINKNTKESEEVIVGLLNNEKISIENKSLIIEQQEIKLNIDVVNESLWTLLLEKNKLIPNWSNIFKYYNNNSGENDRLINFLNIEENAESLSKVKCGKEYSEENEFFTQELLKLIIKTNDLNIKSYEYLIKNTGWTYTDLDISSLDEDKISLLLQYNRCQFKKVCFDTLKDYSDSLHISLVAKNENKLLEEFENFEFTTDDIIGILKISDISSTTKKGLIEKLDYDLISNTDIAKLIYKLTDKKILKPIEYTKKMLENLESLESKIYLLIEQNSEFSDNELIEMLKLLPEEYKKVANLDGKQTILTKNYYNKALIKVLKDRDFIIKDKIEKKNKIRLYIKKV